MVGWFLETGSLCSLGCPRIHRSTCLHLPTAEIKGTSCRHPALTGFLKPKFIWLLPLPWPYDPRCHWCLKGTSSRRQERKRWRGEGREKEYMFLWSVPDLAFAQCAQNKTWVCTLRQYKMLYESISDREKCLTALFVLPYCCLKLLQR